MKELGISRTHSLGAGLSQALMERAHSGDKKQELNVTGGNAVILAIRPTVEKAA